MEMTNKELFQKLHDESLKDYETFKKKRWKKMWRGQIEKYPETAHFVYELLQNADDAKATKSIFVLLKDCLIFKHNGSKHFDVTDVENEEIRQGDINAICSLWSEKSEDDVTIGKFGVGFKSVFKYVDSPEIYDDEFKFRIDNYIIPTELETDHELRQTGETLFVLKFKEPEKAYKHIESRLKELKNPILYLNHLESIEWKYADDDKVFVYRKEAHKEFESDGIVCEDVVLTSGEKQERLYLFTKEVELTNPSTGNKVWQDINVAYYLKEDGSLDVDKVRNIYCFFATSDSYGMCFESHGPFMLNDSRTNILRDDNDVNETLDDSILELASQALLYLKEYGLLNENLFAIVPKETEYLREKGMLAEVKNKFKEVIKNNELVLARDGTYKYPNKVRRGASPELERLISKAQLEQLIGEENVDFVAIKNRDVVDRGYLQEVGIVDFNNEFFANKIDGFLEKQIDEWIDRFYAYIVEYARQLWNKKGAILRVKPIIKSSNSIWIAPFKRDVFGNETPQVFLPNEKMANNNSDFYDFVDYGLFQKHEKFFVEMGLKSPDEVDIIEKEILPKYKEFRKKAIPFNEELNDFMDVENIWVGDNNDVCYSSDDFLRIRIDRNVLSSDFKIIFQVWADSNDTQKTKIIELLRKDWWVWTKTKEDDGSILCFLCKLKNGFQDIQICDDNEQLKEFYPYGVFLDYDKYSESGSDTLKEVKQFFGKLGVKSNLSVSEYNDYYWSADRRIRESFEKQDITQSRNYLKVKDYRFEDLRKWPEEFCEIQSHLMWNCICGLSSNDIQNIKRASCLAKRKYFTNYSPELFECDSSVMYLLKCEKWIYDKTGQSFKPSEITKSEFFEFGYKDCLLIKDLPFKNEYPTESVQLTKPLFVGTPEQQRWQKLGKMAEEKGYSEDDLKEALEDFEEKRRRIAQRESRIDQKGQGRQEYQGNAIETKPFEGLGSESNPAMPSVPSSSETTNNEVTKSSSDRSEKLQEFIDKQNKKIEDEEEKESLLASMDDKKKYSKGWFLDGLKYEYLNAKEDSKDRIAKSISLTFSKVAPEHSNVYCFSNSSQLIPRWLEEIDGDLKVTLRFVDGEDITVCFAMACVQDFSLKLRAKGNDADKLNQINWEKLTLASLDVNNPKGLVKNLYDAFAQLPFSNDFDMQNGLTNNLKFIFGPPGTGKTYYLAHEVISKHIKENEKCKVLVLTPTNQAADVITKELISANPDTYFDWLGRFVATNDQDIEESGLVSDRKSILYQQDKCCLVSTIARLSYDFFENEDGEKTYIKDIAWDYVVCDEGSMISLPEIMYAIYQFSFATKRTQIVIAGDPKQLQPIDTSGVWNAENIYQVVDLNSFMNPVTKPIQFEVANLKEQRRSVPAIGELFSRYSYDGLLSHHRREDDLFDLHLDKLALKPITYLPFHVNNFDDIFGSKKMSGSNIHIYSAILTGELCRYIAKEYVKKANGKVLKIGVICPYIAQVQLIDRLLGGFVDLPSTDIVEISIGTIHSFQGDQRNIIFALFNPPKGMASKRQDAFTMLVNDDHLVNVAISRAQDYLCVMVPDSSSYGRENLKDINRVADVINSKDFPYKDWCGQIDCSLIEELLFGEKDFLKKHSFVSSHQMANVYTPTNYEYEIRVDDNAIDIQIGNQ